EGGGDVSRQWLDREAYCVCDRCRGGHPLLTARHAEPIGSDFGIDQIKHSRPAGRLDLRMAMRWRQMSAGLAIVAFLVTCGWAEEPRRVSREEALQAVVSKVQPVYPPIARQLNLEGTVELEALVSEAGHVDKVTIVSGNPVLTRPSAD